VRLSRVSEMSITAPGGRGAHHFL